MDIKREVARLQKKVRNWADNWVEMPVMMKLHRDKPPLIYNAYLNGEDEVAILGVKTQSLHTWHWVHYLHGVLKEGEYRLEDFALAAHYARATVQFEEAFADAGQRGSILLDYAPFFYALTVLSGWRTEALKVGRALHKGLDTHLLDLRHTDRHEKGVLYRHFWFIMHLFCETERLKLDTSLYSYPEHMSPYAEVLADWRTTDMTKVQTFVSAMADYHVKEARTTAHDEIAEFDTEDRMLFPYEILCWLRLREWAGIANPETFDHPLMQQPLAKMPAPVPLPKPETPLLDQVIEKFKKEYPGSFA